MTTTTTADSRRTVRAALKTYLNDHQGGATGGLALARRLQRKNRELDFGQALAEIADDIAEDVRILDGLATELGILPNRLKQAAARAGEVLSRFKRNEGLTRYSPLGRLLELELLLSGVEGKAALWRALATVESVAALPDVDLDALGERAAAQHRRLEIVHRKAARLALH